MALIPLQKLARLIAEKQGDKGIREVAKEIGISHGTLSRVKREYMPDLETFQKICLWLKVDPGEMLGMKSTLQTSLPSVSVHFKKDQVIAPETAQALAQMILAAQRALIFLEERDSESV